MIQLMTPLNVSLMPSHMPDAAVRIFCGTPVTNWTMSMNLPTTQSLTWVNFSEIQSFTVVATALILSKFFVTSITAKPMGPVMMARSSFQFRLMKPTTLPTTSPILVKNPLIAGQAVWVNQFTVAETAVLMPFHTACTMLRNVSDFL